MLKVFSLVGGPDTVIAESPEDAWKVWAGHTGEDPHDYIEYEEWEIVPDEERIRIWLDTPKDPSVDCCLSWANICVQKDRDPNGHHKSCPIGHKEMTAAEWIKHYGRGFLCSTEY